MDVSSLERLIKKVVISTKGELINKIRPLFHNTWPKRSELA